jgi:hypothetical protein
MVLLWLELMVCRDVRFTTEFGPYWLVDCLRVAGFRAANPLDFPAMFTSRTPSP